MIDPKHLYWAAGFLEGEGSFLANKTGSGESRTVAIQCQQIEREPLEKLQQLFGGTICALTSRRDRPVVHAWKVSGSRARGAMMTVFVLMSSKRREQIRAALSVSTRRYVRRTS